MGVTASMFFITLRYFCSIILPIMIIIMEMKGINFSEVLSLIKVNFWLLIGDRKAAKDILIKLGMPEFAFNLKTINPTIIRCTDIMEVVSKKFPEIKDFNKLVLYATQEDALRKARAEKLLNALFGKI